MLKHKGWLVALVLVAVALVGLRAALPGTIQWYVNRTLAKTPEYDGRVGDIDLSLLAGRYQINDVEIVKVSENVPAPLFSADLVELSVHWSALRNGALVGEARFVRPSINVVDGEEEVQQTGEEGDWLRVLDELFPLRIDRMVVEDGEFHFRNFESEPQVDIYLSNIVAELSNLTNSEDISENMIATLDLRALALDDGELAIHARLNPSLGQPAFDFDAQLMNLPVTRLNDFARAYANLDMEGGTLDVAMELAAVENQLEGYVKPVIHNLEVFEWEEDVAQSDNPLQGLWEGLVATVSELLENQPEDQVATNVPISGSLENVETGVWPAIGNVLRNAFVEAFEASLEGSVELDIGGGDAEGEEAEEEEPQ